MNALAVVLVVALAGQTQVIAVEEGDVVPFVGVCMTNDRARELAMAEAEVQSCELKLAASQASSASWKKAATEAVNERQEKPPADDKGGDEGFDGGVLFGVGIVAGIIATVGAYLLAGWTIGIASDNDDN